MKNKKFFLLPDSYTRKGFTLIEVLIVVSILMILILLFVFTSFRQLSKGRDGRRKSDLEKIKVAFEDYYNDNNCYPDTTVLNNCDGDTFRPYLDTIPCDPANKEPYLYVASDGGLCKGYKLLAKLENTDDPDIASIGCDEETGCGYTDPDYNYGVSQGVGVPAAGGGGTTVGDGLGGDYTPLDYSDDYYCLPEAGPGCTYVQHDNAKERNCTKAFDGPTAIQDCQALCNYSNPTIVCPAL